ncbi:hypothetical protein AVEN_98273-1 [Araneus ventricosus]|uniref:Uncharacterized protein n=1 Tax=Araneus ventricosus TaxID=182803 RepID=A0A4Y2FI38_ARAVE|nr:hypothetical protein AVEN_98273-1 [Araneus ventricosus]
MEKEMFVKVLTTENPWAKSEIQKAQLEDPGIRPILEKKLNSEDRPSWQEIARRVLQQNDIGLFGTPYTLRMMFYIVSGRVTMEALVIGN